MGRKNINKLPKWLWATILLFVVIVGVVYLIIRPYFGWQTRVIDNFVGISYPEEWQTALWNSTELYGLEHIYLISNYTGKLSFGDSSSESEIYRIEVSRLPKDKVGDLEREFITPDTKCSADGCVTKITKFQKSGRNVIKLHVFYNATNSFYREAYFVYVETDKFYYVFNFGFIPGPGSFSDLLRGQFLKRIVDSIRVE